MHSVDLIDLRMHLLTKAAAKTVNLLLAHIVNVDKT